MNGKDELSGGQQVTLIARDAEAAATRDETVTSDVKGVTVSVMSPAHKRKAQPVWSGVINYFPDALIAVAELSRIGNEQHNPGSPLHWDRSKSGDELDALTRHLIDAGAIDHDGVLHSTKIAWRALANLQKELEQRTTHTHKDKP